MSAPRSDVRTTDRGMWLVVARRDFWVRLRDRGFVISTAITLIVLSIFILLGAFSGDDTSSFRLGLAGPGAQAVADAADFETAGERRRVEVTTVAYDDVAAAELALRDGEIDAALVRGDDLEGRTSVPPELAQVVQDALVRGRIQAALADAQVPASTIDEVLNQPAIQIRTLEPVDEHRDENAGIAFIGVLLAYGQLFGYGVWVATGVLEEKSSRVVEVLLSAIRPRQLLTGKIAGIGALGICQLVFIAAFAIGLSLITGAIDLPATAIGTALIVLTWFVMGFAFYAGLFAVSGSLVSRMEELQNAMVPINLLIFASFFISIGALENPDSTLSVVASILPFSSALAMPVRIVLGSATPPQIVASIAALLISTAITIPLSGRLYAGAILRTGARVKLKDAWGAAA